jgi:hypothetical protein
MKPYKRIFLFFILAIGLTSCVMKQEFQTEFPQEIKAVYFQKKANEIHFYIEFKEPLSANINLEKIYFRNQELRFEKITKNTFLAHFKSRNEKQDLILDSNPMKEYGNKAPVFEKSKFDLKPNEALLEYKINNKILFYKISNPKENEYLFY